MPDLSSKGTHQFWHEYPDPIIYKVIAFMESVEKWTYEGVSDLENSLAELGKSLDNVGNIDLQEEDKLVQLASCIKMGRSLRLLQSFDIAHPGAASKILMHAEKAPSTDTAAALFLRRNVVFERMRLLSRIFSEDRLNTITKILGNKR